MLKRHFDLSYGGQPPVPRRERANPVETKALIAERGAYRLTEYVRTIQVPVSVQAILAARIDGLAPEDKRLLQAAAVIGKDVPFAPPRHCPSLPAKIFGVGGRDLQAAEFLNETSLDPRSQTHSSTR